jgi:tRNA pseudouridine55 synthase
MAKKRKGNPVNGWVNFNKPRGMTSTQAVGFIRHTFQAQKAGHGGTLDPLATGVLPIALGEATKTMQFSLEGDKTYEFTIAFGSATNTDDSEGEVIKTSDKRPGREALEDLLPQFTGPLEQLPPTFSAIKIGGEAAYKKARKGEEVKVKPRPVIVHKLALLAFDGETAKLMAHVSKGTYVRSLARDIGAALGCYGHVIQLARTQAGPFKLTDAVTKEQLDKCTETGEKPDTFLLPVGTVLDDIPAYVATPQEVVQLKAGKKLKRVHLEPGLRKVVTQRGGVVSLVDVDRAGCLRIVRNFN